MPTESEIREAIRDVYAAQERAFKFRRTPRYNIAYGAFAGFPALVNHISLVMRRGGGAQLRAGDDRVPEGTPGCVQVWNFTTLPTAEEAYAILGEYFDRLNEWQEQKQAERLQELQEFFARHGVVK